MDEVLGHGGHSGNPAYTKQRGFLIPQQILNAAESLAKYHGTTGVLLAQVVRSLWTQTRLEEQMGAKLSLVSAVAAIKEGGGGSIGKPVEEKELGK